MNQTLTYHLAAELLASLEAEGHPIGTGKHLQVQELLRLLPKDTDAETLRLALCPLLARNPQEQARVYEMFDECRKRVEAMMPTEMEGEPSQAASEVAEKELKKWRWRIIIPAAILVLLAAVGLYFYSQETPATETPVSEKPVEQQPDSTQSTLNLQPETSNQQSLFQPKPYPYDHDLTKYAIIPLPVWQEWLFTNWWWLRWALFIPFTLLLIAIWRYLEHKRRKLIAEREPKDQPPYFWNIRIESGDEILTGESFAYALQVMRRRMGADTFTLDLPRTIHATAERGGLPEFRFREHTQPVDYLLLIDRQSIQNHRARLFDTLYQAFREQEIEMARFFYDSDMRVCFNEEHAHGVGLQELQQRYGSARLLIIGTGAQLISPLSGKLAPWTSLFVAWKQRALFTPKPLADWGRLERRLPEIFTVLPATLQSLSFWIEELEDGQDARFEEWRTRVKDAPQLPIQPNENDPLLLLQLHYDTPMLHWIAACAIYPSLHWDLTLWLGSQVETATNPQSLIPNPQSPELVSIEGLLHLFRLPWFVEGEIPAPARAALLDWLEKEHPSLLLHLRAELALLLQHSPPPQASAASDDYQMNIALNEWLTTPDERRKKELEQEVARLLASGVEADFAVLKYLERPRTPLDFVVPDAWKKYVYPSGYRGLGWQGKWKDMLWVLPVWVLGLTGLFWPWEMNLYECESEKVEYVLDNKTISICLDLPEKKVVYLEWLIRDAIKAGNIKLADSLSAERVQLSITTEDPNVRLLREKELSMDGDSNVRGPAPDIDPNNPPPAPPSPYFKPYTGPMVFIGSFYPEGDKNIGVALFNRGVALYQTGQRDSACYYFQSALNFDSADVDFRRGVEWCNQTLSQQSSISISEASPNRKPGFEAVYVLGGVFTMGSTGGNTDETPTRSVTVSDFYLGKYEVTFEEYDQFCQKTGRKKPNNQGSVRGKKPAVNVKWLDAVAYCNWLSLSNNLTPCYSINGKNVTCNWSANGYRLPTEAEWEYAAKGGNKSNGYMYAGSDDLSSVAWYNNNSGSKTQPVGGKLANELALFDMSGNVWEWCWDWKGNYDSNAATDPKGPSRGGVRVFRGGGWADNSFYCRTTVRYSGTPDHQSYSVGFRVAKRAAASSEDKSVSFLLPAIVDVKGGTFTMGCTVEQGDDCEDDEKPAHQVTLSDFSIGKYEVTNEEFVFFLNDFAQLLKTQNGEVFDFNNKPFFQISKSALEFQNNTFSIRTGYEKYPIGYVSWYAADEYCKWLTKKTGKKYRLPTEAEWEYAARGGRNSKKYKYAGSNDPDEVAWYNRNSFADVRSVGQKKPNELGIFDLSGNAYEWCSDWGGDYSESSKKNPIGPSFGTLRVCRSGGGLFSLDYCRVCFRDGFAPGTLYSFVGFRVVRK